MNLMDKIVSLCKRRGFIYPGSEIYQGLGSIYDYGHYGTLLKNNIKNLWWEEIVLKQENIVGLDAAILMNPKVWLASGHVSSFTDPLIECKSCHKRYRADHLYEGKYGEIKTNQGKALCPNCSGELTAEQKFNLMFKTNIGAVEDKSSEIYLRPETAQGIFVNYKNVLASNRVKIPFGIAQIGKAFRNEITPGNFTYRMREFEQMELEYFVEPGTDEKWHAYWCQKRLNWYLNLGIDKKLLRLRPHTNEELSHYSKATSDIEYKFPWGWGELEGIANRGDYDLKQHEKYSGYDLSYVDETSFKSYHPFVIEPSAGADRATIAFIIDAYKEDDKRLYLRFHPRLAPIKVAVFPLVKNKAEIVKYARSLYELLLAHFVVSWDDRGNIGKRYYAQDEIGTPWCVTVDYQTINDDTVTIRNRDTTTQERIKCSTIIQILSDKLKGENS